MRPIKLTMSAFGPFKNLQTIDFDRLKNSGLFLISGNTGVGKTTILDAISYALYGEVSGAKKKSFTLKCDFADLNEVCFVELEFESDFKIYTIKRFPKQTKKSGVVVENKAELTMPDGKIYSKIKEVDSVIEKEILKINQENFDKLIMIPQGKFQQLLLEKGKQQLETFRVLFQTQIYQKITDSLFKMEKNLKFEYLSIIEANKNILPRLHLLSADLPDESFDNYSSFAKVLPLLKAQNKKDKNNISAIKSKKILLRDKLEKIAIDIQLAQEYQKRKKDKEVCQHQLDQLMLKSNEIKEYERKYNILPSINKLSVLNDSIKNAQIKCERISKKINELESSKKNIQHKYSLLMNDKSKIESKLSRLDIVNAELNNLEPYLQNIHKVLGIEQNNKQYLKSLNSLLDEKKYYESLNTLYEIKQNGKNARYITNCLINVEDKSNKLKENKTQKEKAYEKYIKACQLFYEDAACRLGEKLIEGAPCPVCGSTTHPDIASVSDSNNGDFLEQLKDMRNIFEDYQEKEKQNENDLNIHILNLKNGGIDISDMNEKNIKSLTYEKEKELSDLKTRYAEIKNRVDGFNENMVKDHTKTLAEIESKISKTNITILESKKNIDLILYNIPPNLRKKEEVLLRKEKLENEKKNLNESIYKYQDMLSQAKEKLSSISATYDTSKGEQKERLEEFQKAKEIFDHQLKEENLNLGDFEKLLKDIDQIKKDGELAKQMQLKINHLKSSINTLNEYLKNPPPITQGLLDEKDILNQDLNRLENEQNDIIERHSRNNSSYNALKDNLKKLKNLDLKYQSAKHLSEIAKGGIKRMGLEQYVLSHYFDEVILYANKRYALMSQNQYNLVRNTDPSKTGMELDVFNLQSGTSRDITTLSGGETFIASLSLSLGLADAVSNRTGGVTLGTMFIDEGFGALDPNYLDCVINCLNQLKQNGRMIGIISHVVELKDRIPSQIVVKKSNSSGSSISISNN